MTIIAFIISSIIVGVTPGMMNYPSFGLIGNIFLGLPCWLLGCFLSEQYRKQCNSKLNVIIGV